MTIPEQSVQAVYDHLCRINGEWQPIGPNDIKDVLTAALPHLPQGVGVKKLDLVVLERLAEYAEQYDHPDENGPFPDIQDAMVTVGDLRQARKLLSILSALEPSNKPGTFDLDQIAPDQLVNISRPESQRALEPSAARSLALEERLQAIEQQLVVNLGYFHDEKRILLETLQSHIVSHISAIRALSSPDHADAGKVEGDGSAAARDVLAERRRQIEAEGWTPEHDDQWRHGALAKAATCYASVHPLAASYWPWDLKWWKPSDRRRNLVKAGALILAEIERLDRAASRAPAPQLRPAKKRLPKVPEKRATHPSGGDRHGE